MTREQAIKKLRKIIGPNVYWRIGERLSRPEDREAASTKGKELRAAQVDIEERMKVRRETVLAADADYQAIKAEYKTNHDAREHLRKSGRVAYWRFEVGTTDAMGGLRISRPKAYGDTWEEIFATLEAPKKVANVSQ